MPNATPETARLAQELRRILGGMRRRLREQSAPGDLSPSQSAVLIRLEQDGPATASALARAEGMRAQSMAPVVAGLECAGLLQAEADPADGRQKLYSVTAACHELLRQRREARQDWLERTIAARLAPEEQARLLEASALLARIIAP
ncbi:MAG TPA: MarR family transcriptional regulator [Novosphingobium sp.]|nr:MarR family transcriptional regulator [Novosphingobium sp.]